MRVRQELDAVTLALAQPLIAGATLLAGPRAGLPHAGGFFAEGFGFADFGAVVAFEASVDPEGVGKEKSPSEPLMTAARSLTFTVAPSRRCPGITEPSLCRRPFVLTIPVCIWAETGPRNRRDMAMVLFEDRVSGDLSGLHAFSFQSIISSRPQWSQNTWC